MLRALRDPAGIQRLLDGMPYHLAQTAWSPRRVLRDRTAHCLEGAIFAAAALRALGFPPLLLDLEAVQDTDHVVAVFRIGGRWGAIAKSNFAGLRYREPVYRTVGRWTRGVHPISTGLVVSALARPEWLVEVDAIAVIPEDGTAEAGR